MLAIEDKEETITATEKTESEVTTKALTVNPENWDSSRVTAVTSEDNIVVPVPVGFTPSPAENERYVNGNIEVKGTLSNLTFTSAGDYPWTQNSSNIWVSGNKQQPNSISELISDPITVGANGDWVQIEWSVCSESGYDVLYMYVNDTTNSTSELIGEITGTPYGTSEASLIYTKCGKELAEGTYTISVKYSKYNNTTHTGLDSGYVKSGTFINYDENGADTLDIHKTGGFVIYEGTEPITDLWTASKERNQFVWVPVNDPSRIYETNSTTGKIKAKLWNFTSTGRTAIQSMLMQIIYMIFQVMCGTRHLRAAGQVKILDFGVGAIISITAHEMWRCQEAMMPIRLLRDTSVASVFERIFTSNRK